MRRTMNWTLLLAAVLSLSATGCIPAVGISDRPTYEVKFLDAERAEEIPEVLAIPLLEDFIGVVGVEGPDEDHGLATYYLASPLVHRTGDKLKNHYSTVKVLSILTHVLNWPNGANTQTHGHLILARGYRMRFVNSHDIESSGGRDGTAFGVQGQPGQIRLVRSPLPLGETQRVLDLLAGPTVRMGDLPNVRLDWNDPADPEIRFQVRFWPSDRNRLTEFLRSTSTSPEG